MPCHCRALFPVFLLAFGAAVCAQESSSADTLFQSGVARLSEGKYADAEEAFRKVSELEPGKARGAMALAQVYLVQKKNDEALQLLQAEASKRPAPPDLHVAIGAVAMRVGKYDLAIAEFQTVLDTIDKTSKAAGDLYFRMAEAYRQKGDLDFSIAALQQAQKLQPENMVITGTLGFELMTAGQGQAAEAQYRRVMEADPKNALAINNLAFLLADEGRDLDMALAYAHRARQLAPDELTIADTMGWVYLKMNRLQDAIAIFRDIVQKDPRRAAYRYHLATALEQSGNPAAAKTELEAASKSNPSHDDELKIAALLRKIGK